MTSIFSAETATSSSPSRGTVPSPARGSLARHRVELLVLLATLVFALAVGVAGLLLLP